MARLLRDVVIDINCLKRDRATGWVAPLHKCLENAKRIDPPGVAHEPWYEPPEVAKIGSQPAANKGYAAVWYIIDVDVSGGFPGCALDRAVATRLEEELVP